MELENFNELCLEILNSKSNKRSKHCFKSAVNHLKRAETLFPIDSAMAVFRCYTAEEEAATGLMFVLKENKYINAEKLNPKCHKQKNAVIQFFSILAQFIEDEFRQFNIDLFLNIVEKDDQKNLILEVQMDLGTGLNTYIPNPPFNFLLQYEMKRLSYKKQIDRLMQSRKVNNITKYIDTLANQRNLLLYANEKGYLSEVTVEDKFFPAYQKRVFTMLRTYLMIEPYKEKQEFVQNILDAFLQMLEKQNFNDLHEEK